VAPTYDPLPALKGGFFTAGVLGVTPSIAGLMVLFLGWWKQWGVAPPAHLIEGSKPPLGGTTPSTKTPAKTKFHKPNAMKPTQWRNPHPKERDLPCGVTGIPNHNETLKTWDS